MTNRRICGLLSLLAAALACQQAPAPAWLSPAPSPAAPAPAATPATNPWPTPVAATPLHVEGTRFRDADGRGVVLLGLSSCCAPSSHWPLVRREDLESLARAGGNWVAIRLGPYREDPVFQAYQPGRLDWNEGAWQRLRGLLGRARDIGIYVEVDLIDAWMLKHADEFPYSPWLQAGCATVQSAPLELHRRWLQKVALETDQFDNVLYQVGNETFGCDVALDWEREVVDEMRAHLSRPHLFGTNSHRGDVECAPWIDYVNLHPIDAADVPTTCHCGKPTTVNEYAEPWPAVDEWERRARASWRGGVLYEFWAGWNEIPPALPRIGALRRELAEADAARFR